MKKKRIRITKAEKERMVNYLLDDPNRKKRKPQRFMNGEKI